MTERHHRFPDAKMVLVETARNTRSLDVIVAVLALKEKTK